MIFSLWIAQVCAAPLLCAPRASPQWGCRADCVAAEPLRRVGRWTMKHLCYRVIFLRAYSNVFTKLFITIDFPFPTFRRITTMILFLFLYIFLVRCCFCQLKQCYYTDGSPSADLPCDPSANVSACCGQDWVCWTNLHCNVSVGLPGGVGSCTDQSWHDPACPLFLSWPIIL